MDWDDGVPPPIRRVSREAVELQKALDEFHLENSLSDEDEAAPPPIRRSGTPSSPSRIYSKPPASSPKWSGFSLSRSADPSRPATSPTRTISSPYSQYNPPSPTPSRTPAPIPHRTSPLRVNTSVASNANAPPLPDKSPLRLRLEPDPLRTNRTLSHNRNFSHPFKSQFQPQPQPKYANTSSFRNPPRPLSYRNTSRVPYSLRRWSSLETIDSVQTTQEASRENSIDESESVRTTTTSDSGRRYLSFYDDDDDADEDKEKGGEKATTADTPVTPQASSVSLPRTPSDHSRAESSASSSVRSPSTQGSSSKRSAAASIVRKLKKRDATPEPLLTPENLDSGNRGSLDQRSETNSSTSTMTISSGRPSEYPFPSSQVSSPSQLSVSSKDWKSSNFDTSGLSEAELKKCKKKGINPSLYAEMKAARKGRFVSPIGGNTFI